LGVGLCLSAATVFFRDIMHLWGVFITALMYFSAIFYDPVQMGGAAGEILRRFIGFNPLYWYIKGFRMAVLDGQLLDFNTLWVCAACALVPWRWALWCSAASRTNSSCIFEGAHHGKQQNDRGEPRLHAVQPQQRKA